MHSELGKRPQYRYENTLQQEHPITRAFKADPSIFFPRAQHLIPRFLLPRSCLPLSYLDPKYGSEDNLGADLFSARIELLEQDVRDDPQSLESKVLIAQSAVDGQLHCIERAQSEVYAMCKLDQQVSLSAIEQAQSWSQNEDCQLKRHFLDPAISSGDIWWGAAASSANTSFRKPQNALPGSSRHQNFRVCLQNPLQQSTPSTLIPEDVSLPFIQDQMDNSVIEITEDKSQELEELFKMVKVQYQQALYASKVIHPCHAVDSLAAQLIYC